MSQYFVNSAQECCREFKNLLTLNKYISKKLFDNFLDKYKDTFMYIIKNPNLINNDLYEKLKQINSNGYLIIEKRNAMFVDKKLEIYKDYFDNMFKGIDDNILLDEEQRRTIIIDEDYSLVIAGAGSGKTTTMAAKVKYLVEKCHVDPNKIILLAFTNKAAIELDMRINMDFKLNVEVLTFHRLGMKFLRKIYNNSKPLQIVAGGALRNIIIEYFKEYIYPNKKDLQDFISVFDDYVNFDRSIFDFATYDEYFKFYTDKRYEENKNNLSEYIENAVKRRMVRKRTINGENVKSEGEVRIANYLFENGYQYEYEKVYPYKLVDNHSYNPDFTVIDGEVNYYIEYYGLTTYSKNGKYSLDDINSYKKLIEKKKALHQKHGTDLIELYSQYDDSSNYIEILEQELNKRSIPKNKKSQKDIFYRLCYTNQENQYFKFINLCIKFIEKYKGKYYSDVDLDNLINNTKDLKQKKQLIFIRRFYLYYNGKIHGNYQIDFDDMINYSYKNMSFLKQKYKSLEYDYLIIDEYQDISIQRYNMAKRLSNIFEAKIVAVGDDWQAIYSFSGSDVDLFTNFYDLMGYASISKITNTYRNSQELINVAGDFVSKNQQQFQKTLHSKKHLHMPVEVCYYNNFKSNEVESLEIIVGNIYLENPEYKILILGRYNDDINMYLDSGKFRRKKFNEIICMKYPKAKIEFMSVHSSKGLGYDQVILINAINDVFGFPSKVKDDDLIKLLDDNKETVIDYAEERRLFYVALTRTKNKIYILCPDSPAFRQSEFVREINSYDNVLERYFVN